MYARISSPATAAPFASASRDLLGVWHILVILLFYDHIQNTSGSKRIPALEMTGQHRYTRSSKNSSSAWASMVFVVIVPVEGWDAKILQFHFKSDKPCVPKHRLPWRSPGGSPKVPWRFPGASLEVPGGSPKVPRRFPGASRPTEQA